MEPSSESNNRITDKSVVAQLNAYCQADVKTLWTQARLRNSRAVCGFSYIENAMGEWVMMPTLCQNCQHTLEQVISGLHFAVEPVTTKQIDTPTNKFWDRNVNRPAKNTNPGPCPFPLIPLNQPADTEYLLYPSTGYNYQHNYQHNHDKLQFYRPSLATNGCCNII